MPLQVHSIATLQKRQGFKIVPSYRLGLAVLPLLFAGVASASVSILNFEGLADGTAITTQFPGLVFTHATVLSAGASLNEFEFPPYSGANVIFDDAGPISIHFLRPVFNFGAFFTYLTPVTITASSSNNTVLGSITSHFGNNLLNSGDPGSSPNEFLFLNPGGAISDITIAGDPAGGSFTADDVTVTLPDVLTPEPSYWVMLGCGIVGLLMIRRLKV